jgi:hypothetical protein
MGNGNKMENLTKEEHDTKQIYINSFEAADLYAHENLGKELKKEYLGCFPYSLELIKLRDEGLKIKVMKENGKQKTDDLINVKFKYAVSDGQKLKEIYENKINETKKKIEEIRSIKDYSLKALKKQEKLLDYFQSVNANINSDFAGVDVSDLRNNLYDKGFTIGKTKYVHYKRSAAKSRQGQCLFIKEKLHDKMIAWSRMNLPFKDNQELDLARLLSAECLVSTSIEKTITIHPQHILIIDDLYDTLDTSANIVKMDKDKKLTVKNEKTEIESCLTDGEALLDSRKFEEGQSMMLLRQHMFKAAAFATNIQLFLQEWARNHDIDFDTWEINNMFNEPIPAKDIEMVVTPSCCKFLKFSNLKGSDQAMWDYWVDLVSDQENNVFGVCKHEKQSKLGTDDEGNILQQTSYQMLNSMKMDQIDMNKLLEYELSYIDQLKNHSEEFLKYLDETKNDVNANEMMISLSKKNKNFIATEIFRKFRAKQIYNYVENVRKGKIKLHGDYCVLFGNPLTYLYAIMGQKPNHELEDNQIYTTLFKFDKEVVGFRNPHTSPSNILVAKNTYIKEIETYFKLTPNVVCVNAIQFPVQRILSGADYDSDSMVLFYNETLLNVAKRTWNKYPVCINGITDTDPIQYQLSRTHMFKIDDQLSMSQDLIGQIVNAGQLAMSKYWHVGAKGKEYDDGIVKATILSEVAIDLAKKYYKIDFDNEINSLKTLAKFYSKEDNKQMLPIFWKYRGKKSSKKKRYDINIKCPMDYLQIKLNKIKNAEKKLNIDLIDLIQDMDVRNSNNQQISTLEEILINQNKKINELKSKIEGKSDDDQESIENKELQMRIIKSNLKRISHMIINKETILNLLKRSSEGEINASVSVLNAIYKTNKDVLLDCFIENIPQTK